MTEEQTSTKAEVTSEMVDAAFYEYSEESDGVAIVVETIYRQMEKAARAIRRE